MWYEGLGEIESTRAVTTRLLLQNVRIVVSIQNDTEGELERSVSVDTMESKKGETVQGRWFEM